MEILFIPKDKGEELTRYGLSKINSTDFDEIIDEISKINKPAQVKEVNLGVGADWIFISIGIVTAIISGKKVNEGLDGWIQIAKKIRSIFPKSQRVYIDIEAAKFLAVETLHLTHGFSSIELKNQATIPVSSFTEFGDRANDDFTANPCSVYYLGFEVENEKYVIVTVRSNGDIEVGETFDNQFRFPF